MLQGDLITGTRVLQVWSVRYQMKDLLLWCAEHFHGTNEQATESASVLGNTNV